MLALICSRKPVFSVPGRPGWLRSFSLFSRLYWLPPVAFLAVLVFQGLLPLLPLLFLSLVVLRACRRLLVGPLWSALRPLSEGLLRGVW